MLFYGQEKVVWIYALKDPVDGLVRYVGATGDHEMRLVHHVSQARVKARKMECLNPKEAWIVGLLASGYSPELEVIQECPIGSDWQEAEMAAIAQHRSTIFNTEDGGLCVSPKDRQRRADRSRELWQDAEWREKIMTTYQSEEYRAKASDRTRLQMADPEMRARIGEAQRGKIIPLEVREKLREINLGKKASEETKAKISRANQGKKMSAEARQKMRNTRLELLAQGTVEPPKGGPEASAKVVGGSIWITDGVENQRLPKGQEIPEGWRRGRSLSSGAKERMAASMKGKNHTEEHKRMMSERMTAIRAEKKWR